MKRHLVYLMNFDTRALLLTEPHDNWDEQKKELHRHNQEKVRTGLKIQLGENNFDQKLRNFKDFGSSPFSIVSHHNELFSQARYSFIHGFYYPALTSACALGERILNHLLLDLRGCFTQSSYDKKIHSRKAIQDWGKAIEILDEWKIFEDRDVVAAFHELRILRMNSLHFNEFTITNLREEALAALRQLTTIISLQFGFLDNQIIPGTAGAFFLKKESEILPFVKKYYVPQCPFVSPYYSMKFTPEGLLVFDWNNVTETPISDADFAGLYSNRKPEELVPDNTPWTANISVNQLANGCLQPLIYSESVRQ